MMPIRYARLAAAVCTMLASAPALAAHYTVRPAKLPGIGTVEVQGITEGGVIYGDFFDNKTGILRVFSLQNGQATIQAIGKPDFVEVRANDAAQLAGLERLGPNLDLFRETADGLQRKHSLTSLAIGLDDAGDLFGTSDGAAGNPEYTRGVIWAAGATRLTQFKVPGSNGTFFTHVNRLGTVVGHYTTDGGRLLTGFTLAPGQTQVTPISVPGYRQSDVIWINDTGSLAVSAQTADGTTGAFLDVAGTFTQISPPGAILVNLEGVNNQNLAYGMYETADGVFHPFVYADGTYTTFNPPPGDLFDFYALRGMDASGTIVGYYQHDTSTVTFVAECSGPGC